MAWIKPMWDFVNAAINVRYEVLMGCNYENCCLLGCDVTQYCR